MAYIGAQHLMIYLANYETTINKRFDVDEGVSLSVLCKCGALVQVWVKKNGGPTTGIRYFGPKDEVRLGVYRPNMA